jgi:aryl-alcohol dehydrogenase-like predicted oxidoreductase
VSAHGSLASAAGAIELGDLEVPRLGFGSMRVHPAGHERIPGLLRRVLDHGILLIDTADVYGTEEMIADALAPYPDGVVIATKGGQMVIDGQPKPNGRPEHLREACEQSLRRLRLDRIDLYQLHNPDPAVPLEDSLGALVELQQEGKILHIGVSNLFREQLELALSVAPVVSVQNLYNFGDRFSEPEVEVCAQAGIAFMPYRPIFAGELPEEGALPEIAAARGATPAQVALAWLLARSPAMLPIPGTSSEAHLEENVAAAALRLDAEELERLESYAGESR